MRDYSASAEVCAGLAFAVAEAADGPGLSPPVARRERSVEDVLEIEMPVLEAEESGVSEVLSEGCERGDAVPVNRDGRGDGGRVAAVGDGGGRNAGG